MPVPRICKQCGSAKLELTKRMTMIDAYHLSGGIIVNEWGTDNIEWSLVCEDCKAATSPMRAERIAATLLSKEKRCYPDCDGECGIGHDDLRR